MSARRVVVVLFDGVQSLDVTGPVEVFTGATQHPAALAGYQVSTASIGGAPIRTSSGLTIVPDLDLDAVPVPDTLVVPGGEGTRSIDPAIVDWLRVRAADARRIASVCTGALLLADAGLLKGRRATTHW